MRGWVDKSDDKKGSVGKDNKDRNARGNKNERSDRDRERQSVSTILGSSKIFKGPAKKKWEWNSRQA